MRPALARHDAITRAAVERHRGSVVKMTGDGVHAAFDSAPDALAAMLQMQQAIVDPGVTEGLALRLRCGLHCGADERRDGDFYGRAVNRAARIMSAAHGGQMLVSQAVADLVGGRLPAGVRLRDLGAVRLRDLTSPERVYQVVHPQLRAEFPALRSLEATPNNLTQQLNSFIGRERELTEVRQMLGACRLLTLLGMGGIGKSRLSVQLAAEVLDDYPDGVWFVELAPLTDPRLVAQAVASVLGVKEEAGRPVMEALVKYVRDKQLLIVLDNCEHVVHACADVAKLLLQSGPRVKVLASSRDYLQVAGETTYHVPTLSVPDPNKKVAIDELTRHEAVRLFVDRVSASQPAFRVTTKIAAALADICHRLDGIPLAIELAAARARALSVEAIAARLSDRFRLLVTGDQTVLPRQRTLRALIDWSYDLLTPNERALFQRLSVFAGGWTLEAAEAVGGGGEVDAADVLDLLTHLVEKSLVVMEVGGERYRMLDTVRHYAVEKMKESGEEASARRRHLDHYLAFAETARPELAGQELGSWLARLDLERENLLSAHAWCDRAEEAAESGLWMVCAVKTYWINRGLFALGHRLIGESLQRAGAQRRNVIRCRGLFTVGQLCCFMGRYAEARGYLEESLAIAREIGDKARIAAVLQPLGIAFVGLGRLTEARASSEEAVALARELGNRRELAAALNAQAQLYRMDERPDLAEPLYENVLSLARELGDRESIAIGLLNLAMVFISRASGERARLMLIEVLAIAEELGSRPAGQSAVEVTAGLCALEEKWALAARFFGAAEAQAARTGLRRDAVDDAFLAPLMIKTKEALGATVFGARETEGRSLSYEDALKEACTWLDSEK